MSLAKVGLRHLGETSSVHGDVIENRCEGKKDTMPGVAEKRMAKRDVNTWVWMKIRKYRVRIVVGNENVVERSAPAATFESIGNSQDSRKKRR